MEISWFYWKELDFYSDGDGCLVERRMEDDPPPRPIARAAVKVLSVPKFTANLYCICLSEHETCAEADAAQICGNL